jgi:hypothetical protein
VNATVRALNLPASGDIEGQAAYIQAMSDLLDALPDTPFHNATWARFQEILHGEGDDDSDLFPPCPYPYTPCPHVYMPPCHGLLMGPSPY